MCTIPVLGLPAAAASLPGEVVIASLREEMGLLPFTAALRTGMNTPFGGEHPSEHGRPGLSAAAKQQTALEQTLLAGSVLPPLLKEGKGSALRSRQVGVR